MSHLRDRAAQVSDDRSLYRRLTGALDRDAAEDGVPRPLARTSFWLPVIGFVLLGALFVVSRQWYYGVLREDQAVEWTQFALCLLTTLLALSAAVRFAVRREFLVAGVLLVFGCGSLFLAGEEISWAQRVFAVHVPEHLAQANSQGELNLHNLHAPGFDIQDVFKVLIVSLGVGGTALALLTRGPQPRLRGRFWQLLAPPRYAIPGFVMAALHRPFQLLHIAYTPVSKFQEWVEVGLFISLAMTACVVYLRSTRSPADAVTTDDVPGITAGAWRLPVVLAVLVLGLTVLFVALTVYHGIPPGNPPA
jgi:hypothetical protein